jgi:hypothetical protein
VKCRPSKGLSFGRQRGSHGLWRLRQKVESLGKCFKVEHRAADDQGLRASGSDQANRSADIGMAAGYGVGLLWFNQINQMMRNGLSLLNRGLCGSKIESAIDLG